ncbi:hypothetical protein K440DRAFT_643300 [Wilcoxina mikolae CBS 423.85]|nr:hypothetical protein K440DRAFT_643300 [Wilcoxina mikolae CBS 423.85]
MVNVLERYIDNQRNAEVPDLETMCLIRPAVIRLCAWEIAQSTLEYYQGNLDGDSNGSPVQLDSSPRFGNRPTIYIAVDSQNNQQQNTVSGQGTSTENRQQAVMVPRPTQSDENRPINEHRVTYTHRSLPLEVVRDYRQYRGNLRELLSVETPVVTRRSSSLIPDNSQSYIGFPAIRSPHIPADNAVTIRARPTNYEAAFRQVMDVVEGVSAPHHTPTLADITESRSETSVIRHQQNTQIDSGEVFNGNDDTYHGISITQPRPTTTESRLIALGDSYPRIVNAGQQVQSVEDQQESTTNITAVGSAAQDEITRQIQEEGEINVNFWRMESDINIVQVYAWVREAARGAAVPMGGALFHAVASRVLRQLSPDEVGRYLNSLPSGSLPSNEATDIGSYLNSFPPTTIRRSIWMHLVHAAAEDSVLPVQVIEQTDNQTLGDVLYAERETEDRPGIHTDVVEHDAEGGQLYMSEHYLQLLRSSQTSRPSAQAAMVAVPFGNDEGVEETDCDDDDEIASGNKYFSIKDWFQGHPSDIQIRESRAKAILEAYNDYFPRQPIIRNITTKIYDNIADVVLYIRIEFHCDDVPKVKNGEPDDSTRAMAMTWQLAREMAMSEDIPSPDAQVCMLRRAWDEAWTGRGVPGPDAFLWDN